MVIKMVDYTKIFDKKRSAEQLTAMVYVFYGSSRIGKTTLAKGVKAGVDNFKIMSIKKFTQPDLEKEIRSGNCVIMDDIKTKNEAIRFARFITNSGIKCVLVEFGVFA